MVYVVRDPSTGEYVSIGTTEQKAKDRFLAIKQIGGVLKGWKYYRGLGYEVRKIDL